MRRVGAKLPKGAPGEQSAYEIGGKWPQQLEAKWEGTCGEMEVGRIETPWGGSNVRRLDA